MCPFAHPTSIVNQIANRCVVEVAIVGELIQLLLTFGVSIQNLWLARAGTYREETSVAIPVTNRDRHFWRGPGPKLELNVFKVGDDKGPNTSSRAAEIQQRRHKLVTN